MQSRLSYHSLSLAWIVICILLLPHIVSASVTLPLNGYCKPGRYFPILIDGDDAAHAIEFTANGCLPTNFQPAQQTQSLIPMLATGTPTELKWPAGSNRLLLPKENERLIAYTTPTPEISQIFPGKTAIPILLNPADPLPGPAAAWESLDAIILNANVMQRVDDNHRAVLLAGGVTLASIGKTRPDDRWPWRQKDGLWVLNFPIAGPVQSVNENAYVPINDWTPGWPAATRRQVFGVGLLLVLVTLTLAAWHHRFARAATALFILCFTTGIIIWRHALSPMDQIGGDILVKDGNLLQRDQWVYQRAKSDCISTVPWAGLTHPIFASSTAMDRSAIRLNVSAVGDLEFIYQATANHTVAFVRRDISAAEMTIEKSTAQSPMRELAKEEYLTENSSIPGESGTSSGRWPSVLIERRR